MNLQCAVCGSEEDVDVVCHHCGKLLCKNEGSREMKPCRLIKKDPVFSDDTEAYHCSECISKYHPSPGCLVLFNWLKIDFIKNEVLQVFSR